MDGGKVISLICSTHSILYPIESFFFRFLISDTLIKKVSNSQIFYLIAIEFKVTNVYPKLNQISSLLSSTISLMENPLWEQKFLQ